MHLGCISDKVGKSVRNASEMTFRKKVTWYKCWDLIRSEDFAIPQSPSGNKHGHSTDLTEGRDWFHIDPEFPSRASNNQHVLYMDKRDMWLNANNVGKTQTPGRKGSFILTRKRKRHRLQMGSERIQFNVRIEQRQRSKKEIAFTFAFVQCRSRVVK